MVAANSRRRDLLIGLALFLLAALPRVLPSAGVYLNVDAAGHWITRTKTFVLGLTDGDVTKLAPSGHPGVPLLWLTGAAEVFLQRSDVYERFDRPIEAYLHILKLPMMLVTALAPVGVWWLARRIWSRPTALFISVLFALEPLYLVFSRYLQLDGLVTAFLSVGLLAWWLALRDRSRTMAIVAGLLLGWAGLSRLNGFAGAGFAIVTWMLFTIPKPDWRLLRTFLATLAITIAVTWPTVFVHPHFALATIGWGLNLGLTPHELRSAAETPLVSALYFPIFLVTRTWPFILGLAAIGLFDAWRRRYSEALRPVVYILGFAVFYLIVLMAVRKHLDRYALPFIIPLVVLAGVGAKAVWRRWSGRWGRWLTAGVVAIGAWQAIAFYPLQPYFQTYRNTIGEMLARSPLRTSEALWPAWGEGLREAAIYFKDAYGRVPVTASWFPATFCVYANGDNMRGFPFTPKASLGCNPDLYFFSHRSNLVEYILVSRDQRASRFYPVPEIERLGWQPERVITINGHPYIWIYRNLGGLPPFDS